jgi:hypothetical protein
MGTPKQRVERLLKQLPDDCTLEAIQYHLQLLLKLDQRLRQADQATEWVSQHDAEKRMAKWIIE